MLGHSLIVNASTMFQFIWAIAKPFIDEKTLRKITIKGSDYYASMKEFIEEKDIPSFFGGKCTCPHVKGGCIYSNVGPWNDK